MSPAAFIDANIPIYAAGREHPYKSPCADILRMVAENPQAFITDAEVLQELVHRYLAQRRWALGQEVLRTFALAMLDRIEPVYAADIRMAAELADRHTGISARDLVHAAVMQRLGIDQDHLCGHRLRPPAWNNPVGPPRDQGMGRVLPTPGRFLRRPTNDRFRVTD